MEHCSCQVCSADSAGFRGRSLQATPMPLKEKLRKCLVIITDAVLEDWVSAIATGQEPCWHWHCGGQFLILCRIRSQPRWCWCLESAAWNEEGPCRMAFYWVSGLHDPCAAQRWNSRELSVELCFFSRHESSDFFFPPFKILLWSSIESFPGYVFIFQERHREEWS